MKIIFDIVQGKTKYETKYEDESIYFCCTLVPRFNCYEPFHSSAVLKATTLG